MEKGLTKEDVQQYLEKFGTNDIVATSHFSPISLFLSQFLTAINGILFAAAVFSFFLKNTLDSIFIFAVLLVNGLFSFFQEYRARRALKKLQDFSIPTARVIRESIVTEIPSTKVTVNDIVILNTGDKIPADGIVTSTSHLEIDESLFTGESMPVIKQVGHELFRGTFVTRGKGHMKVLAIGMQTRFGQITQTISEIKEQKTPLQKQTTQLARMLSLFAIVLSLLLLPIGIQQHREFFPLLLVVVSTAVAVIPESLPGVITIALAVGTNKLAAKKAIVRKMAAIETLGATQIILTDKTGTLTKNDMTVKEVYIPHKSNLSIVLEACFWGNAAFIPEGENNHVIGDKTDGALLLWAKTQGMTKEKLTQATILDEYEFDSKTRTITTVLAYHKQNFVYVRGALEEILFRSTLTQNEQKTIQDKANALAKQGLRIIGFGFKKEKHEQITRQHAESHLTFLGLVGLYDPPRESSRKAMQDANRHGIRVIMVTGDNPHTALAIAKEVELTDQDTVLTGKELAELSDVELAKEVQTTNVFARVSPEDKLRLVTIFQQLGFVVGVTGDGVNDALALEKADVGIAMGKKGSDVAKEAADIILVDDDIFTLIRAMKEGRRIYENITKSITYLLAGNLSEIIFVVLAMLVDHPLPLLPTQILWMNLVTDAFPALALASATHGGTKSLFPRNVKEFLLSRRQIFFIIITGVLLGTAAMALFTLFTQITTLTISRTATFTLFVTAQLLLAFSLNKSPKEKLLVGSIVVTIIAQIVISLVPLFQKFFSLGW